MKVVNIIALFLMIFIFTSCEKLKNSSDKTLKSYIGSCFEVSLFSGGNKVFIDYATYVNSEDKTDGWYFKNLKGNFIRLSGNVLIVEVNESFCQGGQR